MDNMSFKSKHLLKKVATAVDWDLNFFSIAQMWD